MSGRLIRPLGICIVSRDPMKIVEFDDDGNLVERPFQGESAEPTPTSSPSLAPQPPQARSQFLRLVEAAAYCRCGKGRLLDWEKRGLIEPVRDPDGRRFFRLLDLDAVMALGPQQKPTRSPAARRRRKGPAEAWDLPLTYPKTNSRPPGGRPGSGEQGED